MEKLEIYIHIPFCVKKCDYCDFLSMCADNSTKREYVSALINEIKLSKDRMKGYLVDTVFIGGGTPSILEGKYISDIMETLRECCRIDENAEITIECNPGTVDSYKLEQSTALVWVCNLQMMRNWQQLEGFIITVSLKRVFIWQERQGLPILM